ncbi:MAG: hypothetical protein RMJ83_09200 [Armatimonadota bacterium]|nr:hypothetical protein [Armatimonadota bacterium]
MTRPTAETVIGVLGIAFSALELCCLVGATVVLTRPSIVQAFGQRAS